METAVPTITPDATGELSDLRRLHFIGIGGAGMQSVARVCAERGYSVSGSDARPSARLESLARVGAQVVIGHRPENVPADATAVVFTHAIGDDNSEVAQARRLGIPVVHRSLVLNTLMARNTSVAVMGTHGKSSTAAILAFTLARLGQDPSYMVGADLEGPGSGGHAGRGELFVAEVDESDRTHIGTRMDVAVVTNIAYDHVENYADPAEYIAGFEQCVRAGMTKNGTLILNADSAGCRELAARLERSGNGPKAVMVGTADDADWRLTMAVTSGGRSRAVLSGPDGTMAELVLRVSGVHQLTNAAAATVALHVLGQDLDQAVEQLRYFDGVQRRLTPAGETAGVRVLDSFAHHPDEVRADLAAASSLLAQGGRVIAVFQPSGARRLDAFGGDFAVALSASDLTVLTDSTRGLPADALEVLSTQVSDAGGSARQVPDRAEAAVYAAEAARPGDVIVLMGAGDIVETGPAVLTALEAVAVVAA
ncbi:UDP-N-acetylmuramate--L-alanine ligase [Streptomyces sp. PTY087I2]|uniref:UDP-N-acetylmuramate--L-alanine ligase n=1 Tax=Streptomyces sp. PTY087I2 TaxID=1819298 RepID=UPI00080BCDAB|nr:Mur ligase domain-containing protein [Streptomyces sp. PTY087I2]OCC13995.1 UDP-N-acetylmuramate--L-alanine ligase [Streptomyces sp. PTY087I2]